MIDRSEADPGLTRKSETLFRQLADDKVFRRDLLRWFGATFLVSASIAIFIIDEIHDRERSRRLADVRRTEIGIMFSQQSAIRERLSLVRSDAIFLRNEYQSALAVTDGDQQDINDIVEDELSNFSASRGTYDSISVLSNSGREILRVNYGGGSPIRVTQDRLQDKSYTSYFRDAASLDYGEIFVSRLGLNVESGEIERPFKPTIRIATQIRGQNGEPVALLVLNYLASALLLAVETSADLSNGIPMMANREGYWMVSPVPPPKWGFMFPGGQEDRMAELYPETWKAVSAGTSNQVLTDEGLFTYSVVEPIRDIMSGLRNFEGFVPPRVRQPSSQGWPQWYVGTFVDGETLEEITGEPSRATQIYSVMILALCFVGSAALSIALAESGSRRRALVTMANLDALTGLHNRRSLEENLEFEIGRARQTGQQILVAFIDIDRFKTINDRLGHSAGDRALADIASTIDDEISSVTAERKSDGRPLRQPVIARFGGDEFVVVFPDVGRVPNVDGLLSRLAERIGSLEWDGLTVGASIGTAIFPADGQSSDELLDRADAAMYAAKQSADRPDQ
ncbi:sensor domain-containing diguanylate cyclase [Amorphus orientalis]|uniref:Diguanylate cyclase (GGDEF)-like protein n=1 Tax=Amorphus orientalis TaxID=649198 RepID=A0AAE4AT10_9HYPH|nr:sensor domain-containing diguanylate cyclase [Amorphus orientalis]MDQ0314534.1 diguanylate cyclase (GGDEF)-like protein [Amorphus orientalis]